MQSQMYGSGDLGQQTLKAPPVTFWPKLTFFAQIPRSWRFTACQQIFVKHLGILLGTHPSNKQGQGETFSVDTSLEV